MRNCEDHKSDRSLNRFLWKEYKELQETVIQTRTVKVQNRLLQNRISCLRKGIDVLSQSETSHIQVSVYFLNLSRFSWV